jgi:hypothetical protein
MYLYSSVFSEKELAYVFISSDENGIYGKIKFEILNRTEV